MKQYRDNETNNNNNDDDELDGESIIEFEIYSIEDIVGEETPEKNSII